MILIQVLTIVLMQFCVGSLLLTSLLPTREIRVGFFTINSLLPAIAAGLAVLLSKTGLGMSWWATRDMGLTAIGAVAAYGCFKMERMRAGRIALIIAGLIGLVALLPMAGQALITRGMVTTVPSLFVVTILAGAFLFGATHVGMILGHWYLLMRRLSFEYLNQFAKLLLAAVTVRGLIIILMLILLPRRDPRLAGVFIENLWAPDGHLFFFIFRIIFGVVFPLILSFLVLRCVKVKANQAATGLLYVAEISVLFGELFAAVLLI